MKIIITESQEKSIKQKIIFMLMDKQKLHQIDTGDRIYFVKKIGDEFAIIRFDKTDGWCFISYDLIIFLSDLTQFQRSEVQDLIGSWVENTLQMKVTSNNYLVLKASLLVENTLQMKVTSNLSSVFQPSDRLRIPHK